MAALALGVTAAVAASVLQPTAAGAADSASAGGGAGAVPGSVSVGQSVVAGDAALAEDAALAASVEQTLRAAGVVTDVATKRAPAPGLLSTQDGSASVEGAGVDGAGSIGAGVVETSASIALDTGLTVAAGSTTVAVLPVVRDGVSSVSPSGLAVYRDTEHSAVALSAASTGGNAGYAVLTGPAAPTEYRFAFTVDGAPATLRLAPGGGAEVLDATGAVVNLVAPAWAKDATGAALPTTYSVEGDVLVQTVQHGGAVYPVVADPRISCDALWCTMQLSAGETAALAANILNAGGACAILGGAAPVCAAVLVGGWAHASIARSMGMCTGFRVWKANFVSFPHLAYVPCYA
jgi:hypothetical protein